MLSVGCFVKGSITAVAGSGMRIMSERSMLWKPLMLEPSKPSPSVYTSSLHSRLVTEKCCQAPSRSVNFTSTTTTSLSSIMR